jgi:cellulose synthase operon protein YhjU
MSYDSNGNESVDIATPANKAADSANTAAASAKTGNAVHLGAWSFYFVAKFLLFWRQLIGFHPLENLAFAAFILYPLRSPLWRRIRTAVAIPAAIALLYYDSWLPPFSRALSQASLLSDFSGSYLLELIERFIDWKVVALLVAAWACYSLAARFLRIGVMVCATLIALVIGSTLHSAKLPGVARASTQAGTGAASGNGNSSTDLDSMLQAFYAKEAQRSVNFPKADGAPFDIIFIHICSLSWDDLQAVGLDKHPLWSNVDFLFRHFNSAASYSGPAAIRINRAPCGQESHKSLYDPAPDQCYLMPNLKKAGFQTNLAFNHDGHFDDFLTLVQKQHVDVPLMPLDGLPIPLRAFDNSPIYDDYSVLSHWFETRTKAPDDRVALFYNTISLHDGNRIVSGPNSGLSSKDSYRPRVEKLLNDLSNFMDEIQKSHRRAIVVIVPEHGAALRGDKYQISGLREIPTPAITTVPVGVKVVGFDATRQGSTMEINDSTSYLAISQLIARLIENSPYGKGPFNPADYATDLPVTDYVAQNENATMIKQNDHYYLKRDQDDWKEYPTATP